MAFNQCMTWPEDEKSSRTVSAHVLISFGQLHIWQVQMNTLWACKKLHLEKKKKIRTDLATVAIICGDIFVQPETAGKWRNLPEMWFKGITSIGSQGSCYYLFEAVRKISFLLITCSISLLLGWLQEANKYILSSALTITISLIISHAAGDGFVIKTKFVV